MEFTKVIALRRSVRKYKGEPVPEEKLEKLMEALQLAPSGNNRQPCKFFFVTDKDLRHRIAAEACHQEFIFDAPVLMVACCEQGFSFDAAIAVDHMILAAVNEGLGTCWVGWFERDAIREILQIPSDMDVPILVPMGFADEVPEAKERKPLEELIRHNTY